MLAAYLGCNVIPFIEVLLCDFPGEQNWTQSASSSVDSPAGFFCEVNMTFRFFHLLGPSSVSVTVKSASPTVGCSPPGPGGSRG